MNDWVAQKKQQYLNRQKWMQDQRTAAFEKEAELDWHGRAWWTAQAKRTRTDWSSLLRQRLRVLAWVRAGRPPWAQFMRQMHK